MLFVRRIPRAMLRSFSVSTRGHLRHGLGRSLCDAHARCGICVVPAATSRQRFGQGNEVEMSGPWGLPKIDQFKFVLFRSFSGFKMF